MKSSAANSRLTHLVFLAHSANEIVQLITTRAPKMGSKGKRIPCKERMEGRGSRSTPQRTHRERFQGNERPDSEERKAVDKEQ